MQSLTHVVRKSDHLVTFPLAERVLQFWSWLWSETVVLRIFLVSAFGGLDS